MSKVDSAMARPAGAAWIHCPGCRAPMKRHAFARKPEGELQLDICWDCHAIWFDHFESSALAPGAVIELFRRIHEHRESPPRPLGDGLDCPACNMRLALTHDIQRTNRISYYRCPQRHGRLTTFFQFLNEKSFVRALTPAEIERLKVTVKQVRCSACGAPVDIGRDPQCSFCRSPVAILDAEAVRKTLAELDAAEKKRGVVDPQAIVDGLLAGQRAQGKIGKAGRSRFARSLPDLGPDLSEARMMDLVSDALDFLGD